LPAQKSPTEPDHCGDHALSTRGRRSDQRDNLGPFAARVAIASLVVVGIGSLTLALWKARVVVSLLFLGITLAAAMRPGVEALHRRGVPRGISVFLHYLVLAGALALTLWLAVPQAVDQVQQALGNGGLSHAAQQSTGVKHDILAAIDRWLRDVPSGPQLVSEVAGVGRRAFEVLIGLFFTLAVAAYWVLESQRAVDFVSSVIARPRRKRLRDTWTLIELKLGAYVRGQLVLVILVAAVLSVAFWAIGLPYWLLVGSFAGIVELVPVIGPLTAGVLAAGVGLTQSVHLAVLAVICVAAVRLLEDYVIMPKVLGHSVGLSPLIVLVTVTSVGIVLGGFAVILAIPIAVVIVTIVDVVVREKDPSEEQPPSVIFSARDTE
jgi:predicted PurR-regulated permease PerM